MRMRTVRGSLAAVCDAVAVRDDRAAAVRETAVMRRDQAAAVRRFRGELSEKR